MLALAVGIGATSAVFSVLSTVLLKPLPFAEFERLVAVPQKDIQDGSRIGTSMPDFIAYQSGVSSFQSLGAYHRSSFSLRAEGLPEQVSGSLVTEQFFLTLGVTAAKGRTFSPDDPDGAVVLSNSTWQRMFHGDSGIIGKSLLLDGYSANVIGVMPPGFCYPDFNCQVWRLLRSDSYILRDSGDVHFLYVFAKLKPKATLQQARAELGVVNKQLASAHPDMNINLGISALPLSDDMVRNIRPTLTVLMVGVVFVLLIACGNVVNLQLGRMIHRTKEFAIRVAHGAGRMQIFWQLLQENLLASMTGGIIGSGLAILGIRLAVKLIPSAVPRSNEVGIDSRVAAFILVLSALTAALCVLISIIPISSSSFLRSLSHQYERVTAGKRIRLLQHGLIVAEVAATLILLVGVSLMTKSLERLNSDEVGFAKDRLLIVPIHLQKTSYPKREDLDGFRRRIYAVLSEIPGVEAVAGASDLPLACCFENFFSIRGKDVGAPDRDMVAQTSVSPGYFAMMGIQVKEGREFTEFDGPKTDRVAIINESMSQRYWPNESPLGRQVRHGLPEEPTKWYTVVGIVKDTVPLVGNRPLPTIFTPFAQIPEGYDDFLNRSTVALIRTRREAPPGLSLDVRAGIARVDSSLGIEIRTIDQIMSTSLAQPSFRTIMFGALASIALFLSLVGIYAVISASTASETRDIAIRLVLGAGPREVLRLVIGKGMLVAGIGLVIGVVFSLFLARFVRSLLFEVSPTDAKSIVGAIVVLAVTALAAVYFPARQATKVYPAIALRNH